MTRISLLISIVLVFASCFKSRIETDISFQWDQGEIKKLCQEEKYLVVCFADDVGVLAKPEPKAGKVDSIEVIKLQSYQHLNSNIQSSSDIKEMGSEVHIFIKGKYSEQDTILISRNNLIQISKMQVREAPTIVTYTLSAGLILGFILLIIGTITYRSYLSRSINLHL